MAFSVHFLLVENPEQQSKSTPWLCDKCHKEDEALLKIHVDYDTLVLCKKCLLDGKKIITDREKELKDERKNISNS
jgi:formylmethanofuran dehydrogenase subunit E